MIWQLPGPAFAHAEFAASFPAAGAQLDLAPTEVLILFSDALAEGGHTIIVTDASGQRVDSGDARRDPRDAAGRSLIVSLQANLAPSTYTVTWRNTGSDGHLLDGSFQFSLRRETRFAWWLWVPPLVLLVLILLVGMRSRNEKGACGCG
ncbi:hypothetical protein HC891_03945 [Candidatus Gracilibacteria bacterium]|nr:hypothetical protein [Candidatus Gracilibacteria bacterium]